MENRRRSDTKMEQYQTGVTILLPKATGRGQHPIDQILSLCMGEMA